MVTRKSDDGWNKHLNGLSRKELESTYYKVIEDLAGLMYHLKVETERGEDDGNHGPRISLHLSRILFATSDAMNLNNRLSKLEQNEVTSGD